MNLSNSDEGTCEQCKRPNVIRDWNNRDKKKVCEACWYANGYHLPNHPSPKGVGA
jgi:hypothetical protein